MKDNSLYKLGSICSILVGLSYVVAGITTILMPPALTYQPDVQSPFMYFEANKAMLLTNYWALGLGAIFALAMIPAVSATVQHLNEGWVRWTSTLATFAFAVVFLDNYWAIVETPARAASYVSGNEAVRAALSVPGAPQYIDIQNWLGNGAVGVWVLVVGLLALHGKVWPKGLAYLWMVGAFAYFLSLASSIFPGLLLSGVGVFVSGIGAILGPIGYGWMGIHLWRIALKEAK